MSVNTLGTFALFGAVVLGVVFLIVYASLAKFWTSREGWYLWVSSFILAEILAYNLIAVLGVFAVADSAARDWVRLAVYTQVLVIMAWRGVLLIQAQLEYVQSRRKEHI